MKIVYHCFTCKKDFVDIDLAKEHSRAFDHEFAEETQRTDNDNRSLMI